MSRETSRHLALLELGVERAPVWRAHPVLQHTVVRRVIDGTEQRVMLKSPAARTAFLREQRKVLKSIRKEFRRNLEMKWTEEEP